MSAHPQPSQRVAATQQRRRSHAAGPHDDTTPRTARKRAAIEDQEWYAELRKAVDQHRPDTDAAPDDDPELTREERLALLSLAVNTARKDPPPLSSARVARYEHAIADVVLGTVRDRTLRTLHDASEYLRGHA